MTDRERLQSILDSMDLPPDRRQVADGNIEWLCNHIGEKNSQHADFQEASQLLLKLLKPAMIRESARKEERSLHREHLLIGACMAAGIVALAWYGHWGMAAAGFVLAWFWFIGVQLAKLLRRFLTNLRANEDELLREAQRMFAEFERAYHEQMRAKGGFGAPPGTPNKDYYGALGVERTASKADIKKKFRALAKTCHPDLFPGDKAKEAFFKEINEAHDVLTDDDKRAAYDRTL